MRAATRSVTIQAPPDKVFDFVANPANLPLWSRSFCLSVSQRQGQWWVETPQGDLPIRIATHRQLRIADQFISPAPGVEFLIPTRVVPNGAGSEFILTLFQPDDLSEEQYQDEVALIEQELQYLREILEGTSPADPKFEGGLPPAGA